MDEQTERRLAALIMEEASRLRRQADEEGVHVYLAKPSVRIRPNPHFLHATVRNVQQANRMVEVNEMWRRRIAELDSDTKQRRHRHGSGRKRDGSHGSHQKWPSGHSQMHGANRSQKELESKNSSVNGAKDLSNRQLTVRFDTKDHGEDADSASRSSDAYDEDLKDEEIEEFLLARQKRGRGAVGSRMDETGPYLLPLGDELHQCIPPTRTEEDWENNVVGPSNVPVKGPYLEDKLWKSKKKSKHGKGKSDINHRKEKPHRSKKRKREEEEKKMRQRYKAPEETSLKIKRHRARDFGVSEEAGDL